MGHRPDWNDKDFKKKAVRKFADGGEVLSEADRIAQENAREMSTVKDVNLSTDPAKEAEKAAAKDKKKMLRDLLAESSASGASYGFASGLSQGLGRGARMFNKD